MAIRSSLVGSKVGLAACLLAFGAWAPASAQQTSTAVVVEEEEVEEEDTSRWSGMVQFDFTNAYFFNGIMNERADFIWQPWAELYLNLFSSDEGFIRDVSVGFGVWNSVHDNHTNASSSPRALYETDWYPMLMVEMPAGVNFTTYYYWYTSPNGAFDTVEELDLFFNWDDSEILKGVPLAPFNPSINFAIETDRHSDAHESGAGVQMAIAPTLFTLDNEDFPLTITAPVELGLSVKDYYQDETGDNDTYGYLQYGLAATLPLAFLDASWGDVYVGLSGQGINLGNSTASFNHGDHNYGIVMGSLGVEF